MAFTESEPEVHGPVQEIEDVGRLNLKSSDKETSKLRDVLFCVEMTSKLCLFTGKFNNNFEEIL